jgi:hypothetical protein
MDGEDIHRRPPIYFGDKLRESESQSIQDRMTAKLLEATKSSTVIEFLVKLVYGEDFHLPARLLDTKIEAHGKQVLDLADAIEQIQSYNNFRGPKLACQLQYLHQKGYVMDAKFGREGSPVIYINPPYWTHQASNSRERNGRAYSQIEYQHMKNEILRSLKRLEPDELDDTGLYGIRAWWD